jgi:hypothetical protein
MHPPWRDIVALLAAVDFSFLFAAASGEVLFLLLAPFWVITLIYFGGYAAHTLMVVIEQTAAGFDRVHWPREGFLDWIWKFLYLLGVAFAWVAAAELLVVPAMPAASGERLLLVTALLFCLVLWLIYPVSLLCSMSGASRLHLLRWQVVKRLACCWPAVLLFYTATALLAGGVLGLAWFAVGGWQVLLTASVTTTSPWVAEFIQVSSVIVAVPVTGLLLAAGWLVYGRLIGRLGWLVRIEPRQQNEEPPVDAEEEEPIEAEVVAVPAAHAVEHRGVIQMPPAPDKDADGSDTAEPEQVSTSATYPMADEPPDEPLPDPPFRWSPGRMPPPPPRSQWRDLPDRPPPLADDADRPEPPPRWNPGWLANLFLFFTALLAPRVFLFPFYRTSIRAWLCLAFGIMCLAALARLQLAYW